MYPLLLLLLLRPISHEERGWGEEVPSLERERNGQNSGRERRIGKEGPLFLTSPLLFAHNSFLPLLSSLCIAQFSGPFFPGPILRNFYFYIPRKVQRGRGGMGRNSEFLL